MDDRPTTPSDPHRTITMDEESDILYQEFIKSFLEEQAGRNNSSANQDGQNANVEGGGGGIQLSFLDDYDDDDPNDPEYNVFQDLGTLDFDEFLNFYQENPVEMANDETATTSRANNDDDQLSSLFVSPPKSEEIFTADQLVVLQNQFMFHVQILVQNWLLAVSFDSGLMEQARKMLRELNENPARRFFSYVHNLAPATAMIESQLGERLMEDERRCSNITKLSASSKKLFVTRREIFPFEWALPTRRFSKQNFRIIFPRSVDAMIAFALYEYNKVRRSLRKFKFVHERYLPTHPVACIRTHVKNLCRGLTNEKLQNATWSTNPIIEYYREKKAPNTNLYFCRINRDHFDRLGSPPKWYTQMNEKDEQSLCIDEQPSSSTATTVIASESRKSDSLLLPKGIPFLKPYAAATAMAAASLIVFPPQQSNLTSTLPADSIQTYLQEIRHDSKMRRKRPCRQNRKPTRIEQKPSSRKNPKNCGKDSEKSTMETVVDDPCNGADHSEVVKTPEVDANVERNNEFYEETDMDENYGFLDEDEGPDEDCLDDEEEAEKEDDGPDENMMIDDENDLMALMQASWTTVTNRNLVKDGADQASRRKSDILALHRESSKFLLQNDPNHHRGQEDSARNELLINYYLKQARKLLSEDDYVRFLELIASFVEYNPNVSLLPAIEVYGQIKQFLMDIKAKYCVAGNVQQPILDGLQELIELLVMFLDFFQAQQCDQAFQFLHWRRIFDFFRKVELYLSFVYPGTHQPQSCIQRLIRSLNQLSAQQQPVAAEANHSVAKVKAAFSKILNHHPMLMKEFSALFLEERPQPYLFADDEDFDEFVLPPDEEDSSPGIEFENAVVPVDESDLKYGTNECPCRECHHDQQHDSKNFGGHCSACSIRFISGRIYLPQMNQNNKKLQLVEYVKTDDEEETNRNGKSETLQTVDLNRNSKPPEESVVEPLKSGWTMAEDRLLLQACRSMILDSNITTLTEQVIEQVATNLVHERDFGQRRSVAEITERLMNLIEMLTTSATTTTSSSSTSAV